MWGLAAGTAFTLYQRMRAVYVDAKAKASRGRAAHAAARGEQSPAAKSPAAARLRAVRGSLMETETFRERLTSAAFGAGWNLVCRLPESVARALFNFGADIAWRREGAGVQVLEGNLVRVLRTDSGRSLAPQRIRRGVAGAVA